MQFENIQGQTQPPQAPTIEATEPQLRAQIATMNENLDDLLATVGRYGESTTRGWRHPDTLRLQHDIDLLEERLRAKRAELQQLRERQRAAQRVWTVSDVLQALGPRAACDLNALALAQHIAQMSHWALRMAEGTQTSTIQASSQEAS